VRNARHQCDVMEPSNALGSRGQEIGGSAIYIPSVPFSLETLNGRELEQARANWAEATYRVQMQGNPHKPITSSHWLKFGDRRLSIGHVIDEQQNGQLLTLICGEMQNLKVPK
jgi:SPP1 family predicted phage head-tail adaptor